MSILRSNAKKKNPKSPYAKYAKRPYVYSQAYREWFRAARKANGGAAPVPQGG